MHGRKTNQRCERQIACKVGNSIYTLESAHLRVAPWRGVYCVYVFRSLSSYRVLYIGEAYEIESTLVHHRLEPRWKRIAKDHDLYFTAAEVMSESNRGQGAAAMIYHHRPPQRRIQGYLSVHRDKSHHHGRGLGPRGNFHCKNEHVVSGGEPTEVTSARSSRIIKA